jgi:multicomponent Na+:H+ antiporter subunit F
MNLWWIFSVALLLNIVVGLGFITSRKSGIDSLLATLLFGTTGLALTLVLGMALDQDRAVDIALVFALLAAVLGVAFARRGWFYPRSREGDAP